MVACIERPVLASNHSRYSEAVAVVMVISSSNIIFIVVVVGGLLLGCYIECNDISQDEKRKT